MWFLGFPQRETEVFTPLHPRTEVRGITGVLDKKYGTKLGDAL